MLPFAYHKVLTVPCLFLSLACSATATDWLDAERRVHEARWLGKK